MAEHDLFVRQEMSNIERAVDVLELILDENQRARLDLDGMELLPTEYVNQSLQKIITDLTYKVPIRDDEAGLCMVMEHKSKGALGSGDILAFQLREQEIKVMKAMRQNDPDNLYPIVMLVGLYHGPARYPGPRTVAERMRGPADMVPGRWRHDDIIYVDLFQFEDEFLLERGRSGLFLLVLKHIYDDDLMDFVKKIVPHLQKLDAAEHRDFLTALFRYLITALSENHYPELSEIAVKSFSKETGGAYMTIAEYLTKEVREELEKEKEKALREKEKALREKDEQLQKEKEKMIFRLFRDGVDLETIARYTDTPVPELEKLLRPKAS